jgi:hypothetical protein
VRALPRKPGDDLPDTMFLRPQRPGDHREFDALLPWCTPLFVYENDGNDWIRWSIPKPVAARSGMDAGCACCGESMLVEGDNDDYFVDTAWRETDWWLQANGYALPDVAQRNTPTPQKENEK